jgi:hypothetical protein
MAALSTMFVPVRSPFTIKVFDRKVRGGVPVRFTMPDGEFVPFDVLVEVDHRQVPVEESLEDAPLGLVEIAVFIGVYDLHR